MNKEGDIIIKAKEFKSKDQNEKAAFKRLNNAIEKVLNPNPHHLSEEERERKKREKARTQTSTRKKTGVKEDKRWQGSKNKRKASE